MLHGLPTFRVRAEEGLAPQPAGQGVFYPRRSVHHPATSLTAAATLNELSPDHVAKQIPVRCFLTHTSPPTPNFLMVDRIRIRTEPVL